MLSLIVDHKPLDLSQDASITMRFLSPIFNTIGDYSYPFKLPATERNKQMLGWKHRIEGTADQWQSYPVFINWNDITLGIGTLKVKQATVNSYEATIYMDRGDFNYQAKYNYLQNYDYGELEFDTEAEALAWINGCKTLQYPTVPCAFPQVYNGSYFEEYLYDDSEMKHFNFYWNIDDEIHAESVHGQRTPIVPFLYLRYVLDKLFLGMGYNLDDAFFSVYPDFNKLILYNSVTCNNEVDAFGVGVPFPYQMTKLYWNYHLPRIKVGEFISGLETMFNVRFFVNNINKSVKIIPLSDVLAAPQYVNFSRNVLSETIDLEERQQGFKIEMQLDGDDAAFTAQTEYEESILKTLKGSVKKLSELPEWPSAYPFEIRYVIDEEKYYKMWDKTWAEMDASALELKTKFIYRTGDEVLSTKLSTLIMGDDVNTIFCTVTNAQANFADITARVFFAQYGDYADHMIVQGYNYMSEFGSLFFNGNTGLFIRHFKEWLDWRIDSKLVKIQLQMDYLDILKLDFSKKFMMNGMKYLISEVQITFAKSEIRTATISAYTCN